MGVKQMKIFNEPNPSNNWKCPICKTNEIKPVVLIGVDGTEEGKIMEAQQYHLDCIDLIEYKAQGNTKFIGQVFYTEVEEEDGN